MTNIADLSQLSVLLVDDDALVAIDTEDMLRALGVAQVVTACNEPDALRHCDAANFNAALLDVGTGFAAPFAVADRLSARGIPFAFLTGFGASCDLPERFAHFIVISKPADSGRLLAALVKLSKRPGRVESC